MKVSHVIYKIGDIHKGVEEFRAKGFTVEYGKEKNPYNALIYFSKGPYLELLSRTGMPAFAKKILGLGKNGKKLVRRLNYWDNHPGGFCGLLLDNYEDNLDIERAIMEKHGQGCFEMNIARNDTKGRKLAFRAAYPYDMQVPGYMTYFSTDPKPKNYVHPNGVVGIQRVAYGARQALFPLIQELCDDEMLELHEGDGVESIELSYAPGFEARPNLF